MGRSGGSRSVSALVANPLAKGLMRGVIAAIQDERRQK